MFVDELPVVRYKGPTGHAYRLHYTYAAGDVIWAEGAKLKVYRSGEVCAAKWGTWWSTVEIARRGCEQRRGRGHEILYCRAWKTHYQIVMDLSCLLVKK